MKKSGCRLFYIPKCHDNSSSECIRSPGFTIVELLIVIVVIGILATIAIVSYTGITQRANAASLQSDLANASQQLKLFQIDNSAFPLTVDCSQPDSAINKCLKYSSSTTYQYAVNNIASPQTFCIAAIKSTQSYKITDDSTSSSGDCLGYGLVMHLDASNPASYPGSGSTWTDLSGNGSNGTLMSGAVYTSDGGGAISFGVTGSYVSIPYTPQYNIRYAITLSVWIKRTTTFSQSADTMILSRSSSWYFYDSYTTGNIRGEVYNNGTRNGGVVVGVPYDGNWYQVTYTYDSYTHIEKIYRNGGLVSSHTLPVMSSYLIDASTANFQGMGLNTLGRGMNLNDAYVYSRALSDSEILQTFNATKGRYGL